MVIPLAVAALFGGIFLLWALGQQGAYFRLIELFGIRHHTFPFLDGRAMLSWAECARLGLDVFVVNPCGEPPIVPANYPPFWKLLELTPLDRNSTAWLGWSFLVLFVAALAALPAPRDSTELTLRLLASLSPSVAYALERANPETLIFAITVWGCVSLLRVSFWQRWLAWPLFLAAGAIKLYPIALLGLAVRESWRVCMLIGGVAVVSIALFWFAWQRELGLVLANVPGHFAFADQWGARNLAMGLANLGPRWFAAMPWLRPAITLGVLLTAAVCAITLLRHRVLRTAVRALPADTAVIGTAGALLLAGCYATAPNVNYRAIHLLLMLPVLFALLREAKGDRTWPAWLSTILWLAIAAALFGLYSELGRNALGMVAANRVTVGQFAFWLAREAAWFAVFVVSLTLAGACTLDALARWPGLAKLSPHATLGTPSVRPPACPPARP